ncbi:MAG: hypothetical protein WD048_14210 [Chitinophagales bacterium]
MSNKIIELEPKKRYHIFNRANGNESCFLSDDNYRYFLRKYKTHIYPIADTYTYCLMPNHFHFVVKIKKTEDIETYIKKNPKTFPKFQAMENQDSETTLTEFRTSKNLQGFKNLEGLVSQQFSNFFNAYTKAFNNQQNRKGSLFMHTFKRNPIITDQYFCKAIHYTHYNPVEAGLCKTPDEWKFSSYNAIISNKDSLIKKEEVLDSFGGLENFIHCHTEPPNLTGIDLKFT